MRGAMSRLVVTLFLPGLLLLAFAPARFLSRFAFVHGKNFGSPNAG